MATKKKTKKRQYKPWMSAADLTALVQLTLIMAGPEEHDAIEAAAAGLDGRHSLNNRIAIAAQEPNATCVFGKVQWREHGRRIATTGSATSGTSPRRCQWTANARTPQRAPVRHPRSRLCPRTSMTRPRSQPSSWTWCPAPRATERTANELHHT